MDTGTSRADPLALSFPKLGTLAVIDGRDGDYSKITWQREDGRMTHGLTTADYAHQLQAESVRRNRVAHLRFAARFRRMATAYGLPHCVSPVVPPPAQASLPPSRARTCTRARGAGRPRTRRVARAASRGGDSGDDGSGSEPPGETTGRHLHLVPDLPARPARYTYGCLTAEERGA